MKSLSEMGMYTIKMIAIFMGGLALLTSCSQKAKPYADYVWNPDIEKLKGKGLRDWILKAPFRDMWDPSTAQEKGAFVITNEKQVFPFMANYKKEDGILNQGEDIHQQRRLFFKDGRETASFVHATLLTHEEPIYLDAYNSSMGNVAFSGVNAINESYSAKLQETFVYVHDDMRRSALYWVQNTNNSYFLAFYQKQNLVLQVAFPCAKNNKQRAILKIREINKSLNLGVKEWQNLTADELQVNNDPKSFWEDPYVGIFLNKTYFIHDLRIKIKKTRFVEIAPLDKAMDYTYVYEGPKGQVTLSFGKAKTALNALEYEEKMKMNKEFKIILHYSNGYETPGTIYGTVHTKDAILYHEAETYFKDNALLEIKYSYPEEDTLAKETIENILEHLKINTVI